jgi:hypothetical protein
MMHRVGAVDIEGKPFVGITRYLPADATHAETRVRGGLWADANDAAELARMREIALAFAIACEERIAELGKPKAAKAHRAPTQAPPAPAPVVRNPAPAPARKPALASLPKPAPITGRSLSPAAPAPSGNWFADLMAQAGA